MLYKVKKIKGYEGYYEVDTNGVVYGVDRIVEKWDGNKMIKRSIKPQNICNSGYMRVALSRDNKVKKYLVHRLVALAFLQNRLNKPDVNHKDGNKINNKVENLEWVTKSENTRHAMKFLNVKFGTKSVKGEIWYKKMGLPHPSKKPVLMFDKNNNLITEFSSLTDAGLFLNKHSTQILYYIQGKRNNKIYNFKYKNN